MHSQSLYFGDIKPYTLLIFKDLSVKLADFGVSVKIPANASMDDKLSLVGLTNSYSLEEVIYSYKCGD